MSTNSASKALKERPILFNARTVRALLAGRKTQVRCVVKLPHESPLGDWQPTTFGGPEGGRTAAGEIVPEQGAIWNTRTGECLTCPFGQPGDRLWVRETWQGPLFDSADWDAYCEDPDAFKLPKYCHYAADGRAAPEFINADDELVCRWQSSTSMPRWASRITLEIVSVRIERVQAISEEDAIAEGIARWHWEGQRSDMLVPDDSEVIFGKPGSWKPVETPQLAYKKLWDIGHLTRGHGWDTNPWVWVVKFKKVEA